MTEVVVREILMDELDIVAKMHSAVLADEFIARFGHRFLRRYYRAFSESPYAVALVAVHHGTGSILGALLGTLNPSEHYRYLTRRHGVHLASIVVLRSLIHFNLARDLVQTRAKRYTQGVMRSLVRKRDMQTGRDTSVALKVCDLTHLFVNRSSQSQGVGTLLTQVYITMVKNAGVDCIDLVTAPVEHGGAGPFYEKLGWDLRRIQVSQSEEKFLLYRLTLSRGSSE
jgi:GNAT superfamily N-acetyltransferase